MERNSFIFYRSFYEALKDLSLEMQGKLYVAIMEYALNGTIITIDDPVERSIFTLIRPVLDNSLKQYANGSKGGAPRGNRNASKKQPKNNPKTTQKQPNENPKQAEYIQDIISDKESFDEDEDKDVDVDKDFDKDDDKEGESAHAHACGSPSAQNLIDQEKKIKIQSLVVAEWNKHYQRHYATAYVPDYRSNTTDTAVIAEAVGIKMGDYQMDSDDPKQVRQFLADMFETMRTVADQWQREHWNLHTVATQFNELYNAITNGKSNNGNSNNRGITGDYVARKMQEAGLV